MYIDFKVPNEEVRQIELNEALIAVILKFINQDLLYLNGDYYNYFMNEVDLKALAKLLELESRNLKGREQAIDFDLVLADSFYAYADAIYELTDLLEDLVEMNVRYSSIYISKDYSGIDKVLTVERKAAVENLLKINGIVQSSYYQHQVDTPNSVEKDYFDGIKINWSWGIGFIEEGDEVMNDSYIPLKDYCVRIQTEVRQYFTGAFDVTYTAFHIYRNAKDHRYSYKVKRAQRTYRMLLNEDVIEEVTLSNEKEYFRRIEQAENLQSHFIKEAEQSILKLYKLYRDITKPFVKNQDYYNQISEKIERFIYEQYIPIVETYFLLGVITANELDFHKELRKSLIDLLEVIYDLRKIGDEVKLVTKQAKLLRYFAANTEIAPRAGIIKDGGNNIQRTLMQIEQERCYSEEFRSDDSIKEYYRELTPKKL